MPTTTWVRGCRLSCIAFIASSACAKAGHHLSGSPSADIVSDSGARLETLAPGVHAVIRREPLGLINESNTLLIVGDTDVVVVDAQSSTVRTRETLALLRTVTRLPVRAVINTHSHDDHAIGNHVYLDAFPNARVIAHQTARADANSVGRRLRAGGVRARSGTIAYLRDLVTSRRSHLGGEIDAEEARSHQLSAWLLEDYSNADSGFTPAPATETIRDRLRLTQGRRIIDVLHPGRGHTRGDVVVHLPNEGILAAGDLMMTPVQFVGSTSYPAAFATSLDSIRSLRFQKLLPGHGRVMTKQQADSQATLIASMLRHIDSVAVAAAHSGRSVEAARAAVELSSYEREIAGTSRLRLLLFDYYIRSAAVARAYELAAPSR